MLLYTSIEETHHQSFLCTLSEIIICKKNCPLIPSQTNHTHSSSPLLFEVLISTLFSHHCRLLPRGLSHSGLLSKTSNIFLISYVCYITHLFYLPLFDYKVMDTNNKTIIQYLCMNWAVFAHYFFYSSFISLLDLKPLHVSAVP
jgi:hypothetical protein